MSPTRNRSRRVYAGPRRGERPHLISLRNPGTPTPDGEGGHVVVSVDLGNRYAEIKPATVHDMERIAPGTVQSSASHLVTFDYEPNVTTETEIVFGERVFAVNAFWNPDEANVDTVCACKEVVASA